MNAQKITIRPACYKDAPTIAQAAAMALGDEAVLQAYCGDNYLETMAEIARENNTQYSWRNAWIAEVEGVAAGAVIGYDGARLAQLREGTFSVLRRLTGRVPELPDETQAGEYYLDSLGVLPQFRGLGVGRELVSAFCRHAFAKGYPRVGLLVDEQNPKAAALYTDLGFQRVGTLLFFDHSMWHMQRIP